MTDIDSIKEKYERGELDSIKNQLLHFICLHYNDFTSFIEKEKSIWGKPVELFTSLRLFILDRKTIDFKSEMLSQVDEINREIEAKGCGCDPAMAKTIKADWLRLHAASWRAHRILEIIYVLNRNRAYFLEVLDNPSRHHSV
ncbi:MAG: hypothetical protein JNL74_09450 [Fibrobacteres bacterium]|nr:hypothetical protein [Fibrobacterota bacterium]